MTNELQQVLDEAAEHMGWIFETHESKIGFDNIWLVGKCSLPVNECDEYMERFVKTFFPEHYKELFR